MGPIWGWQDPGGPHVGPMNFAIWVRQSYDHLITTIWFLILVSWLFYIQSGPRHLYANLAHVWSNYRHNTVWLGVECLHWGTIWMYAICVPNMQMFWLWFVLLCIYHHSFISYQCEWNNCLSTHKTAVSNYIGWKKNTYTKPLPNTIKCWSCAYSMCSPSSGPWSMTSPRLPHEWNDSEKNGWMNRQIDVQHSMIPFLFFT